MIILQEFKSSNTSFTVDNVALTIIFRQLLLLLVQVAWLTVRYVPFPAGWRPEAVGLFVLNAVLGVIAICFK